MMAGYSKRSLVEKLGIKSGQKIYIGNPPRNYHETLGALPEKVFLANALQGTCDFIQFFSKEKSEVESTFPQLKKNLAVNGALWVSWPKGASGIKTDLNENMVREIGLKNGLVDV